MEKGPIPSRESYLDAVFAEGGYLSRAFAGYKPRAGQVAFARAVDAAIAGRKHLISEAGTGTGKSFGYAVPASYVASTTGKQTVIVTANIALQEQIAKKDLPFLQKIAPWDFTYAMMKGRSNYLCVSRYYDTKAEEATGKAQRYETADQRRHLQVVQDWASDSIRAGLEGATGDSSELPFEPDPLVWRKFSVSADECKKSKCRYAGECFSQRAMQNARGASVIVTNYHLLFASLAVYRETGIDIVLPPAETIILDEAHKAPDIARDCFGFKITEGGLKRIARRVDKHLDKKQPNRFERIGDAITDTATYYFGAMASLASDRRRYNSRLDGNYQQSELGPWGELDEALARARAELNAVHGEIMFDLDELKERGEGMTEEAGDLEDVIADIEIDMSRMQAIQAGIGEAMRPLEAPSHVFFLEGGERGVALCSKLIRSSDALRPNLFQKRTGTRTPDGGVIVGPEVTVIATSATIQTEGSFRYIADELGCDTYSSLVADSPFDWERQALFVVPSGLPDPKDDTFPDAVAKTIGRVIRIADGRTLGLFTSRRVLAHTYDAIVGQCREMGIRLMRQGDAPRTKLIAEFKADVRSVLLGTESFWAGVDVPGESLSCVVIDRLPFATPEDPVLAALAAKDDAWFFKYSLPRAIIQFKQGFGRLIRSLECRGAVVCCDNRLTGKRYGKQFLKAIPNVPKSTRLEAIGEFLHPAPPAPWDAVQ